MALSFRLRDSEPEGTPTDRLATPDENVSHWQDLHRENAYFDQHGRYRERLHTLGLARLSEMLDLDPSDVLLDVGCGYGRLLWHLAPRVERAIGSDLASAPIDEARTMLADRGSVELHVGNGLDLSQIASSSISKAFGFTVIQQMSRRVALGHTTEIARVLRPGGRCVLQLLSGSGDEDVVAIPGEQSISYSAT